METIEISVSQTTLKTKGIKLPYYTKWVLGGKIRNVYKIYSKDHCILVSDGINPTIDTLHAGLAFNNKENVEATEEEFNEKFQEVLTQIKNNANI
jgi:hypothetical protein